MTITGLYLGTNPELTVVGAGASGSIAGDNDARLTGGATITANIPVPACADGSLSITVTSASDNGTGFFPAYAGEPSSASSTLPIVSVPVAAPAVPDAPQILFGSNKTNLAGTTTNALPLTSRFR